MKVHRSYSLGMLWTRETTETVHVLSQSQSQSSPTYVFCCINTQYQYTISIIARSQVLSILDFPSQWCVHLSAREIFWTSRKKLYGRHHDLLHKCPFHSFEFRILICLYFYKQLLRIRIRYKANIYMGVTMIFVFSS